MNLGFLSPLVIVGLMILSIVSAFATDRQQAGVA
jgi:hypothetical protein